MSDARDGDGMFEKSTASIRVTAQWSVHDPVVYVKHGADSECVDLAISGPGMDDVVAHVQLTSPLDVLTAGHNLISAGLDLAETLGMDLDQVQAAIPSVWWNRGRGKPDADAVRDDSPDS